MASLECSVFRRNQRSVAQCSAYLQPRLVKAALERRLTDSNDLRCLARRQAFDVAQYQRDPMRRCQLGDCEVEGPPQLLLFGFARRPLMLWRRKLYTFVIDRDADAGTRAFLKRAIRLVDRDSVEPGEIRRASPKPSDASSRPQERLLDYVLGLTMVAEQTQHDRIETIGMHAGELFKGGYVTVLGPTHEFAVRRISPESHSSWANPRWIPVAAASARTRSKMVAGACALERSAAPCSRRSNARTARIPRLQSGQSWA